MIHIVIGGVLLALWLASTSEPRTVSYDDVANGARTAAAGQQMPQPAAGWPTDRSAR